MTAWAERKPIECACGNHSFVAATKGYVILVSPEDAGLLSTYRWKAWLSRRSVTITRWARGDTSVVLSREILDAPRGRVVDHINSDETDNRRENLRLALPRQNSWNARKKSGSKNPAKGIAVVPSGRFCARISAAGTRVFLGTFDTLAEAQRTYRAAAKRLHGEFARAE